MRGTPVTILRGYNAKYLKGLKIFYKGLLDPLKKKKTFFIGLIFLRLLRPEIRDEQSN